MKTEQPKRVLVVEDEVIVAKDIARKLERWGYAVTEKVHSGEDALKSIERSCPDMVLMDIRLAGELNGIETATVVRDQYGVPVLFLTAHSDEKILAEALGASPYGYLLKPFSEKELHTSIQTALNIHSMEVALRQALMTAERERAKFEAIVSGIGEGLAIFDRDRRFVYQNAIHKERVGDRSGSQCPDGCEFGKAVCDDNCALSRSLRTGTIIRSEEQVDTEDGTLYFDVTASPLRSHSGEVIGGIRLVRDVTERMRYMEQRGKLLEELYDSVSRVKQLSGLIPVCASCKKIRDDGGYWGKVEEYLGAHTNAQVDQSLCPDCTTRLYPEEGPDCERKPAALSDREKEVLQWVGRGKNNWEISKILGISERTVKFHVGRIMARLDAVSRTQAVVLAMELGILEREQTT